MIPGFRNNSPTDTQDFAIFQRFNRAADMREVVEVLREDRIPVRVSGEDAGEWREARIIGSPLQPGFWIEIPADQFEKANYVLQDYAERTIHDADLDEHPFAEYSPDELQQVLLEETDWSPEAVVVARKLLLRSGHEVDLQELRRINRERVAREFAPRSGTRWVIALATLYGGFAGLALWIVSLMIAGGVLGYYLAGSQRDPKGVRHPVYNAETRAYGKVGLTVVGLCLVAGLLNAFYLHLIRFPPIDIWYWLWF